MISEIIKKLHYFQLLNKNVKQQIDSIDKINRLLEKSVSKSNQLTTALAQNINILQTILGTSEDIIVREFIIGNRQQTNAALIFLDGLSNSEAINHTIIKPLMEGLNLSNTPEDSHSLNWLKSALLPVGKTKVTDFIPDLVDACLMGDTILLINGFSQAMLIGTVKWEKRSITEPMNEPVVRGPREGFIESLRINITLLRRKIRNPCFTFEIITLGRQSKTDIAVIYLDNLAAPRMIRSVKRRIQSINMDAILDSGYITQLVETAPFSIFSTVFTSEKPDIIAAKILEGRIAILVDGSPIALTTPMLFIESFQSGEDYYSRPYYVSIIRLLRFLAFSMTISLPSLYVVLTSFQPEMVPTLLLISMLKSSEGLPFPVALEALAMGVSFELMREASIRLPRAIGSAISIVGALVIGDAAVSAGIVGAPIVIINSLTAITSFIVPAQADAAALLRLLFILAAGFMGVYGIIIVFIGVILHLCAIRSFGVPYLSPLAPLVWSDLKDVFIRVPLRSMTTRPKSIGTRNLQRQNPDAKTIPSDDNYAK